jgi:hypothetical protein
MAAGSSSGGGSEGIKAGRAYVEIGAKDAGLKAGLAAAKRAVLSIGKDVAGAGAGALGLGSAVMAPILESLREVVEHFSAINRAAIRTGSTTESISDLGYAAKASGTSLGAVEAGLKFLDKTMSAAEKGSESATEALAAFGLTAADLKGMDADQKMLAISKGLQGIEESAQGPALRSLLGRGGVGLRPMLESSTELARLLEENGKIGGRVSKEDAANAEKVEKAYLRVTSAVKNAFLAIGAAILPHAETIGQFATALSTAIGQVKAFIDENRAAVVGVLGVGAAIAGAGAALVGLGTAVALAGVALGGLVTLAGTVGSVLAVVFSPVGLAVAAVVVAALVGIAALLESFPEEMAAAAQAGEMLWGGLADTFRTTWQGIKDALAAGDLGLAFEIAVDGLNVVWKGFLVGLTIAWNSFKDTFLDAWYEIVHEVSKLWIGLEAELAQAFLGIVESVLGPLSKIPGVGDLPGLKEIREAAAAGPGETAGRLRAEDARYAEQIAAAKAARALSLVGAAGELAAAKLKLAADVARAKPPPVEAGPMPREVARQAAVEGLGAARGQFGGYGAGFSLGVGGESVQKKQLGVLEQIEENTRDGGGVEGW